MKSAKRGKRVVNRGKAMDFGKPVWGIRDVAEFFRLSVDTVRRMYNQRYKVRPGAVDLRQLRRDMVGGVWRWYRDEVVAFAAQGRAAL